MFKIEASPKIDHFRLIEIDKKTNQSSVVGDFSRTNARTIIGALPFIHLSEKQRLRLEIDQLEAQLKNKGL